MNDTHGLDEIEIARTADTLALMAEALERPIEAGEAGEAWRLFAVAGILRERARVLNAMIDADGHEPAGR